MIVKVCGLRDPENIRAVDRLAVDLCGFIFYPRSPRCVPDDELHAAAVRSCRKPAVGSSSTLRPRRCSARPNASASGGSSSTATNLPVCAGSFGSAASG